MTDLDVSKFVEHLHTSEVVDMFPQEDDHGDTYWYEVQEDDEGNRFFVFSTEETFPLYRDRLYFVVLLNQQRYDIPLIVVRQSSAGRDAEVQAVGQINSIQKTDEALLISAEGLLLAWSETF